MVGWRYTGPFDELTAWKRTGSEHEVIAWDEVSAEEGTGIVHIAPGSGREDFAHAKEHPGMPVLAPVDESGVYIEGYDWLTGQHVADIARPVFESLKEKGYFYQTESYEHVYPHCWRCKTELIFRLVDEWFISMGKLESPDDNLRKRLVAITEQIRWIPGFGLDRELDWLRNMEDWMISKKRYYGLTLPIYPCASCGTFEVIGSKEELRERAVAGWEEFEGHSPHRPWVDAVKIKCATCDAVLSRIEDVGNPWLDAGIVSFSTLRYHTDKKYWKQWYPADFITESFPGQFRNWFYALLAMSTMMADGREPFKTLLGHGLVRDQYGHEMHKSAGNSIEFVAAADEGGQIADPKGGRVPFTAIGADVMRWMYCRHNPASNLNFGPEPAKEVRGKFHIKLWNCYSFFVNYARLDGFDPAKPQAASVQDIDRWILSDLQGLIATARKEFEAYNVMAFCLEAE